MSQGDFFIDKDACREVYVILNKLNLYNRIPEELRKYLEENQNIEHDFDFNESMPLFYQVGNEGTKEILTYLFIKYINSSEVDAKYCKDSIIEIMKNVTDENL